MTVICTRRNRLGRLWIGLVLAAMTYPAESFAQRSYRNLKGTITDRHHEPLKAAVVHVENEDTKEVISYITGPDGHYGFKRLSGDTDYRVWATFRGHQSPAKEMSLFDSGKSKTINLTIKLQ